MCVCAFKGGREHIWKNNRTKTNYAVLYFLFMYDLSCVFIFSHGSIHGRLENKYKRFWTKGDRKEKN